MSIIDIPILRRGEVYESLEQVEIGDHRTGEPIARVHQANAGLIRKDLRRIGAAQAALQALSIGELLAICRRAGELFMNEAVELYEGGPTQTPQAYVEALSATSGMPQAMLRRNMEKIYHVFTEMPTVLKGLTRGMDLGVLDSGLGEQEGVAVSYLPTGRCLGAILPSNSPGVHSLWIPSIALKTPLALKPGREEPWTPFRIIGAFIAAGCPKEAFSFYPTSHEGAGAVMDGCDKAMIFGGEDTVKKYEGHPNVQAHGPGWSKILIGEDCIDRWVDYLDIMVESVAANGGRSCINASTILVPRHGREIAEALAAKLAEISARGMTDEKAVLSAFVNRGMAEWINNTIEEGLKTPGVYDVTAVYRGRKGGHGQDAHATDTGRMPVPRRMVEMDGSLFLLPTAVYCESTGHPLFNKEFLFPFVSIVEIPQEKMLETIGYSLVVSAITDDEAFRRQILQCGGIDRLNLGPVSTCRVQWDQPHEGNLFEFLYRRRAIYQQKVRGSHATEARQKTVHGQDARATLNIRRGAYLPHWTQDGSIYAVTFRLADSLPPKVLEEWLSERENIVQTAEQMGRPLSDVEQKRLHELHSDKVEKYLDTGHGACWMKDDRIAEIVTHALNHFDGQRYDLAAWCVMPNHVHVVVKPRVGQAFETILHSWKSFTALAANKILGRTGPFWQAEYYDHLVRDEKDFRHAVAYVVGNPETAGLKEWKWVGGMGVEPTDQGQDARATDQGQDVRAMDHGQDAHVTEVAS